MNLLKYSEGELFMDNTIRKSQNIDDRFLNFSLAEEEYCIQILQVREIMGKVDITALPQTPDFIQGVINLRGNIVPIIDLRLKFGLPFKEYDDRTTVIFVEIMFEGNQTLIGIVVDTIDEVINISKEKISNVPYINTKIKANYIEGIAETEEGIKIVLDINKVLTKDEFEVINEINKTSGKD